MYCTQNVSENIVWIGGSDRRIALFENMFPLDNGVMYNSYLILDKETVLIDTVDRAITAQFFENIEHTLAGRTLDYLIINHMEPDHCANIEELVRRYPKVKLVGNKKTFKFIEQFYNFNVKDNYYEVKEGDELLVGEHTLKFYMAPMVHWPETMMTYEVSKGILFSADAFGSFGGFNGNLFADEINFDRDGLDEARRYYCNIVGKYGSQVQVIIKKLSEIKINMICPLHGLVWRENFDYLFEKYNLWSKYIPEENGVVLFYASMYGNTENAMHVIANKLACKGIKNLRLYDVSKTNASYIIADVFKYSHFVVAGVTYNNALYHPLSMLLSELAMLGIKNRKVSIVSNGSWASQAGKIITEKLSSMKDVEILGEKLELTSALKSEQMEVLDKIVETLVESLNS
jgi:Uncharacterized flavoproteins